MFKTTRRGFIIGCSTAIAAMAGGVRFTAFGSAEDEPNQDILIVVFLRGGMDGLSLVMPIAGADRGYYEAQRPNIAIPVSGTNKALSLNSQLGLHPAASPLFDLYQAKKLAFIHAAGLTSNTRSHFDAMQYMEMGTPDNKATTSGWLTRHLQTAGNLPPEIILPVASIGNLAPLSLAGSNEAIGMTSPRDFSFNGHWRYVNWQRQSLREMYSKLGGAIGQAGVQTLNAVDVIEFASPDNYTPGNGATYPSSEFGSNLKAVAQVIKMQLGLRVATVDLGAWDTHEYQGDDGDGYFADHVSDLATGLNALFTDLSNDNGRNHTQRLTVVVMSEFGRSFGENASRGTDHGHGNVMMVLGGQVNGGSVFGQWPGLGVEQLYDNRDLQITTDYRRVLSEILIRRHGNPNLGIIFPGYANYQPLGVVAGADLSPNYTTTPAPTSTPVSPTPNSTQDSSHVYLPTVLR
ncbi:MAG: DUF1501 domain-containing protein [Caldilineaceae bacterium]